MSFLEALFSFWKRQSVDEAATLRPKIYDQVEVAFWKSNTYRAENGDLEDINPSSMRVISYWDVKRGSKIELNVTFPESFPTEAHSIRVQAVVVRCQRPRRRKRYRIDCQLKEIDVATAQKIQEFKDWALNQP